MKNAEKQVGSGIHPSALADGRGRLRLWADAAADREVLLWEDALPLGGRGRLPANGVGRLLGEPDPDIDGMQDDEDYPDED